jgi:hypothetical protein
LLTEEEEEATVLEPLKRSQRSVKEQDLVDYIAIQELDRPLEQHQRYVSSSDPPDYHLAGWQADRLSWQLEPQVGKRPKRMRGQESPLPSSPPPLTPVDVDIHIYSI